jgi:hypothetical protein
MGLRILMIGNDSNYLAADAVMLRERGLRVYVSEHTGIINELIDEVRPDLIFINWQLPDKESTDAYHSVLDNIKFASIPVIYTLSEDDVYLVNRKRTAIRERRNIISDSVVDAVKMALVNVSNAGRKRVRLDNREFSNIATAYRA